MSVDTPAWARDAVFYQIFPDRFAASERVPKPAPMEPWDAPPTLHGFKGGDLLGVVEHLDHIASLGANAIYLNPIFQSASNHRYHTYDYFTVDPLLGGNEALRELLDAAHARDIRVVLDGVFNHTGRGFWPFHHVLESGAASPYRRWFHFDEEALEHGIAVDAYPEGRERAGVGINDPVPGTDAGEGAASRAHFGYEAWWDLPALPKLNIDEPVVREYVWSVAEHWLRFGIDGWRLDVPGEIQDPPFWAEFRRRCRAVNPEAYLVGEIWMVAPDWVAGDRFDALMNYPLAEAILGFVAGGSLNEPLVWSHREYAGIYPIDGPAFAGRLVELLSAYDPDVTAVQLNLLGSHDTPRPISILGGDRAALELAVALQATLPGAPCIYYGDEIGLAGGLDPDSRRAFPWNPARWDEELLASTRRLFALRHAEPLLRRGHLRIVDAHHGSVSFDRADENGRLAVGLNAGLEAGRLTLARDARPGADAELLFRAASVERTELRVDGDGTLSIELAPRSAIVVRVP
ncbi:MAG TPA: glycoside hydrolase family 13 protein [Candidatus Limnocylindrales bacterium]